MPSDGKRTREEEGRTRDVEERAEDFEAKRARVEECKKALKDAERAVSLSKAELRKADEDLFAAEVIRHLDVVSASIEAGETLSAFPWFQDGHLYSRSCEKMETPRVKFSDAQLTRLADALHTVKSAPKKGGTPAFIVRACVILDAICWVCYHSTEKPVAFLKKVPFNPLMLWIHVLRTHMLCGKFRLTFYGNVTLADLPSLENADGPTDKQRRNASLQMPADFIGPDWVASLTTIKDGYKNETHNYPRARFD